MLLDIADIVLEPEAYVCVWRDGELYVELLATLTASTVLA
jgi:hypothetical protein